MCCETEYKSCRSCRSCRSCKINNGICTECGLCTEDELVIGCERYTKTPEKHPPNKHSFYAYSKKRLRSEIQHVLACVGAERRFDQILEIFELSKNQPIKMRLSVSDRTLVALYYLQKRDGVPVVFKDLELFTKIKKSRFLLAYRTLFPYSEKSPEYFHSLYLRCWQVLQNEGISTFLKVEEYLELCELFKSIDQQCLCYGAMILHSDQLHNRVNDRVNDINDRVNDKVGDKVSDKVSDKKGEILRRISELSSFSYTSLKRVVEKIENFKKRAVEKIENFKNKP